MEEQRLGLLPEAWSALSLTRCEVIGEALPAALPWLYTVALLARVTRWPIRRSAATLTSAAALARSAGARPLAPSRTYGSGFRLWAPEGLADGAMRVWLDGMPLGELDLHADGPQASAQLLAVAGLQDGYHTLTWQAARRMLTLGTLDALSNGHSTA